MLTATKFQLAIRSEQSEYSLVKGNYYWIQSGYDISEDRDVVLLRYDGLAEVLTDSFGKTTESICIDKSSHIFSIIQRFFLAGMAGFPSNRTQNLISIKDTNFAYQFDKSDTSILTNSLNAVFGSVSSNDLYIHINSKDISIIQTATLSDNIDTSYNGCSGTAVVREPRTNNQIDSTIKNLTTIFTACENNRATTGPIRYMGTLSDRAIIFIHGGSKSPHKGKEKAEELQEYLRGIGLSNVNVLFLDGNLGDLSIFVPETCTDGMLGSAY